MKSNITRSILFGKLFLAISFSFFLAACTKKTETLKTATLEELLPLKKGKIITYRLDSLVFFNGGKSFKTNSYQIRHVVDSLTVDNLNRPTWLVNTFLNDTMASSSWVANGSYRVTIADKNVEVIENNLRVLKLYQPVKEGFTWLGNSFLPQTPYAPYGTSISIGLWDFTYTSIDATEKIGNVNIPGISTVFHIDDVSGIQLPAVDFTKYASREYSIEKYAKNIGLVYREHYVWVCEPSTQSFGGFGVKLWMIAHN